MCHIRVSQTRLWIAPKVERVNCIRSIEKSTHTDSCIGHPFSKSTRSPYPLTRHNDDDYHQYRIRPYQREKSNTIRTSQSIVVISHRSYNGRNGSLAMTTIIISTGFDPINEKNRIPFLQVNYVWSSVGEPTINCTMLPLNRLYQEPTAKSKDDYESAQLRLHPFELSEVLRLQLSCTPTTLATSKKPGGQQQQRQF